MPAVRDALLKDELHELLGGRAHVLEALSERDDGEAHAFEVLHHLDGSPSVEGDLADVEPLAEAFNELLDIAVVDDVSLRCLEDALFLPEVVGDVVAADPEVERVLGHPEVREDRIPVVIVLRREHEDEGGDVGRAGKVEPAVADAALKVVLVHREVAGVPFVHRHPADGLLHPLVEAELPEGVLLAGVLLRALAGRLDLVDADRDAEARVRFLPDLRVRPVLGLVRSEDDRVEGRIVLPAVHDVQCLLMLLVADGVRVVPGGGDEEEQGLHPRVAGSFGHDVEELAVRLRVKLVEDDAVRVEPVLVRDIRGQHLVEAVRRQVFEPLLRFEDLHAL